MPITKKTKHAGEDLDRDNCQKKEYSKIVIAVAGDLAQLHRVDLTVL